MLTLPLTSVTVNVTVLAPSFEQVNVSLSIAKLAIPQASELPPSTSCAVIVTEPLEPACTEMFWQTAFGAMLSSTVTLAEQVLALPFTSVTVKVTVGAPVFAVWLPRLPM